jgi:hypothetical protein
MVATVGASLLRPISRGSKAGKPRHVILTDEGQRLFAALTAGRLGDDPIFTRGDGATWGKSHQSRPMLEACQLASGRFAKQVAQVRRLVRKI